MHQAGRACARSRRLLRGCRPDAAGGCRLRRRDDHHGRVGRGCGKARTHTQGAERSDRGAEGAAGGKQRTDARGGGGTPCRLPQGRGNGRSMGGGGRCLLPADRRSRADAGRGGKGRAAGLHGQGRRGSGAGPLLREHRGRADRRSCLHLRRNDHGRGEGECAQDGARRL